jgi:hypothetical protein
VTALASGSGNPATDPASALSECAQRIAVRLADWPRRTLVQDELWQLLDEADPSSAGQAFRRALLASVVAELASAELVRLPSAALMDRSAQPARDVPMRERSLEIFGDEKALDRLVTSVLFGPGRLSLTQLRAYRSRPPLPAMRVGEGPVLLVVENSRPNSKSWHRRCPRSA